MFPLFLILGCKPAADRIETNVQSAVHHFKSNDELWDPSNIPVCFEERIPWLHFEPIHQVEEGTIGGEEVGKIERTKSRIKQIVQQTFSPLGFNFTGWGECSRTASGIRVLIAQAQPIAADFGKRVSGVYAGITFSIDVGSSHESKATIIHEFGHLLGLHHEQNRRENRIPSPGRNCFESNQMHGFGEIDTTQIGVFDKTSIMNYCYLFDETRLVAKLSAADASALRELYFGVVANMENLPKAYEYREVFSVKVSGIDVKNYRYNVAADEGQCLSPSNYSKVFSINDPITVRRDDHRSAANFLCVIGQDSKGVWQKAENFSSVFWEYVDYKFEGLPEEMAYLQSSSVSLQVSTKRNQAINFRYKVLGKDYDVECTVDTILDRSFSSGGNQTIQFDPNAWNIGLCVSDGISLPKAHIYRRPFVMARIDFPSPVRAEKVIVPIFSTSGQYAYKISHFADGCNDLSGFSRPTPGATPIVFENPRVAKAWLCLSGVVEGEIVKSSVEVMEMEFGNPI